MSTHAKTKNTPQKIAISEQTQPILAFNKEGLIDVFLFDDLEPEVVILGLDKNVQIPLPTLAKANMLFNLSQATGLVPGINLFDDEAILEYLSKHISPNIINPEVVMTEIIEAWNAVAEHDLSTKYQAFNDQTQIEDTLFAYQGAYELVLNDYIVQYISTLQGFDKISTPVFLQSNELIRSTIAKDMFNTNLYMQMDFFIQRLENITHDLKDSVQIMQKIKSHIQREKGEWFTTINGYIGFELEILFSEESLQQKQEAVNKALLLILSGEYDDISKDKEILDNLEQTLRVLRAPGEETFYNTLINKETLSGPSLDQIRECVYYNILKAMHANASPNHAVPFSLKVSPIDLAGSSVANEEKLLGMLLDETQYFTPSILKSILHKSKNELLREVAQNKLSQPEEVKKQDNTMIFSKKRKERDEEDSEATISWDEQYEENQDNEEYRTTKKIKY